MGVGVIVGVGVVVGVRVTVGVKVRVGVRVAVGIDVEVSEGALVYVLVSVDCCVGAADVDEEGLPLHPIKVMSIRTNRGAIIFVSRLNLYSTIPPNYYTVTSRLCRANAIAPIIYKKREYLG